MKKYIAILISLVPYISFGQSMSIEKLPALPKSYTEPYVIFQAHADAYYTSSINADRAGFGKSPMVNDANLNKLALKRALSYAEYIIGVESSGLDTTNNPEYLFQGGYTAFGEYKRNPHYGAIGPENFHGCEKAAGYIPGYDLNKITENQILIKNDWLTNKSDPSSISFFYEGSQGHLDTRRNTGGGWEKYNWKKYGYAIIFLVIEGPNLMYIDDPDCICLPTRINSYMISFEVFVE